jgi:hypothetical protein
VNTNPEDDDSLLQFLKDYGFEDIDDKRDYFIVEGDLVFYKEDLNNRLSGQSLSKETQKEVAF